MMSDPVIIQGGMGVGVSSWRLAGAVSRLGALGVVSGTALDQVFARRLQEGDPGGHMRRGLDQFPFREMAERVWRAYYVPGGKPKDESYQKLPMHTKEGSRVLQELCMVANFVEVFLASEDHGNPMGINYLEKVQIPHLPSIYGAMLAGVDYVLMGAGIPLKIPGVLDRFVNHEVATYPLQISGARDADDTNMTFDPRGFADRILPPLRRPRFLAIIASNTLATTMLKKANGRVDGFIIEGPVAGGHNAPPRGKLQLDEAGEPVYGERDCVDLEKIRELGVPFWLAGGYGTPEKLREALAAGAAGIQVGTAFAFCEESGLREGYKRALLQEAVSGRARVFTDPLASPTGFPFKVAQLGGTVSDPCVYLARPRVCDLGYLREAYRAAEGSIDYRCPGEPVTTYVAKGGKQENTLGRRCLCNALLANIGHPQVRNGKHVEQGLITAGDDLAGITRFLVADQMSYRAADVVEILMGGPRRLHTSVPAFR
jgi:nitronate monooxygenase